MKEKMSLEEATMKALLGQLDTPEEQKDDVEGIIDGVLVVTDPEITPDEYTEVIDNAQEILEDTPEGEVPFNDQYVGEYLLTCPICGSSFINKNVLNVGDSCPICTEVPEQGFILNGQVATQEDVELQNDIKSEEEKEENDDVNIGLNKDESPEEEPVSEEDVEEVQDELLASEVTRESDKKLEETKIVNATNDDEFKQTVTVINDIDLSNNLKVVNFMGTYFCVTEGELHDLESIDDPMLILGKKIRAKSIDELINNYYDTVENLEESKKDYIKRPEQLKEAKESQKNEYEFKAGYYEWHLLKNGKVIAVFNDFVDELPEKCTKENLENFIDSYLLTPIFNDEEDFENKEDFENAQEFNEAIEGPDREKILKIMLDRLYYEYGDLDESKKIKTEGTNKYIPAEEKLEAIYDDYKKQGMLDAYWTDLLNLIDDFDALNRWFDASYPEDEDEDWDNLEED